MSVKISGNNNQNMVEAANPDEELIFIPDHFIKCLCLAFTCANCAYPQCIGGKFAGTCCCLDGSAVWWKPVDHFKACCIIWSGSSVCVNPKSLCKFYEQCFCFECFCAVPSIQGGYRATSVAITSISDDDVPRNLTSSSVIMTGNCCSISSIYYQFPDCLGAYEKRLCLCIESETIMCKPMCMSQNKANPDALCVCTKGHTVCVKPTTCVKSVAQWYCCDSRCALPCDNEVPCVCTFLPFCTCCVAGRCNIALCLSISSLVGPSNVAVQPAYQQAPQNSQPMHNGQPMAMNNGQPINQPVQMVVATPV